MVVKKLFMRKSYYQIFDYFVLRSYHFSFLISNKLDNQIGIITETDDLITNLKTTKTLRIMNLNIRSLRKKLENYYYFHSIDYHDIMFYQNVADRRRDHYCKS